MLLNIRSWPNILPVVKEIFYRCPLPFIFTLLATVLALLLVHEVDILDEFFIATVIIVTIIYLFIWSDFIQSTESTFIFFSLTIFLSLLFYPT